MTATVFAIASVVGLLVFAAAYWAVGIPDRVARKQIRDYRPTRSPLPDPDWYRDEKESDRG